MTATPLVHAVRAVLSGTSIPQAAADIGTAPEAITEAVETYHIAGEAALHRHAWFQANIQFADWHTAEHTAAIHLAPLLLDAETTGVLGQWWFIRKAPRWRLRCQPTSGNEDALGPAMRAILDRLRTISAIEHWRPAIYEPETPAFGGPKGIAIAHALFHADSRAVLDHAAHQHTNDTNRRRERSLLLCTSLLRAARQEWHEQGDIWHRISQMRPLHPEPPTGHLRNLTADMHHLLTADPVALHNIRRADSWADAFQHAGQQLADAALRGDLERGLRDVLAHHVIFHWNRLGIPAMTQALLARAARDAILGPPPDVA